MLYQPKKGLVIVCVMWVLGFLGCDSNSDSDGDGDAGVDGAVAVDAAAPASFFSGSSSPASGSSSWEAVDVSAVSVVVAGLPVLVFWGVLVAAVLAAGLVSSGLEPDVTHTTTATTATKAMMTPITSRRFFWAC